MDKIKFGNDFSYVIVEISNNHILSVYEENGRDGGYIWLKDHMNHNGNLTEIFSHIAYDWKDKSKYDYIRHNVKDIIPSFERAYGRIEDRVRERKIDRIKRLKEELYELENSL